MKPSLSNIASRAGSGACRSVYVAGFALLLCLPAMALGQQGTPAINGTASSAGAMDPLLRARNVYYELTVIPDEWVERLAQFANFL